MDIHRSARKHGVGDSDIRHAVEHAMAIYEIEDEEPRRRLLSIGPDAAGNLLEIVVVEFDDGRLMAIHAMRMRRHYGDLVP